MLTDQKFKNPANLNWTIVDIKSEIKKLNMNIVKKQRYFKTHPHLFFKQYNLSIYIDASFEIKGKLNEFLLRILNSQKNIYVLEHPDRNSIFKEMNAVILFHKENKKIVNIIKIRYNKNNYPSNNGLSENCLIIRKHNELECINLMNLWFQEIYKYSKRDQLSFNYILWKTKYKFIKYISKKYVKEYFKKYIHLQ